MIMPAPKGLKYWIETDDDYKISDEAPEWAKSEFKAYQEEMVKKQYA